MADLQRGYQHMIDAMKGLAEAHAHVDVGASWAGQNAPGARVVEGKVKDAIAALAGLIAAYDHSPERTPR